MSGHTFKVGDRVTLHREFVRWTIIGLDGNLAWLKRGLDEPDGPFYTQAALSQMTPLPLFAAVVRWAFLYDSGELGISMSEVPGVDNQNGRWVKVVISPAEDQS